MAQTSSILVCESRPLTGNPPRPTIYPRRSRSLSHTNAGQGEASEVLESAAAAMGLLHVIRSHVSRGSYWRESYHASAAPSFLALLALLLPRQPRLHPQVVAMDSAEP